MQSKHYWNGSMREKGEAGFNDVQMAAFGESIVLGNIRGVMGWVLLI